MTPLHLLWIWIAVLNAVVLAAAGALLVRRRVHDGMQRRAASRRMKSIELLLSSNPEPLPAQNRLFRHKDTLAVLLGLLSLLQGRECTRVVDNARALGAEAALHGALQRGTFRQRLIAAEALGYFLGAQSKQYLFQATSDADARVATAAMKSLVRLGDGAALVSLLDLVRRRGAGRQSSLAGILREAAEHRPSDIVSALELETDARLQVLLIDAVAGARLRDATPTVRKLAAEGEPRTQSAARLALDVLRTETRESA